MNGERSTSAKSVRVAVASSDGRLIDQHFGWATQFYVYDVGRDESTAIELRLRPHSSCGGECDPRTEQPHLPDALEATHALLSDCTVVLVSRIGPGPAAFLATRGMRAFELGLPVEQALQRIGLSYLLASPDENTTGSQTPLTAAKEQRIVRCQVNQSRYLTI
jgi:predicted Fe-Mo cluster-binding NifX family protein